MTIPEDRYRNMYFMNPSLGMPDSELQLLPPPGELHGPCYMPDLSSDDVRINAEHNDRLRREYNGILGRRAYYQPIGVDYGLLERNAVNAFWPGFIGFPHFEDEASARDWYESMGVPWPEDGPTPWSHMTVAENLKTQAKTLRERAFARLFQGLTPDDEVRLYCAARWEGCKNYKFDLKGKKLRNILAAARRNPEARKHLAAIPIASPRPTSNANDELVEPLQDLGDIIVHEITLAYEEEYFPRPVGVAALEPEHVTLVMKSMQREIDRESRGMRQVKLEEDLSWERQVALAERRRMWFAKFGITPKSWKTGRFNLWKISNEPFPEGYPTETRYSLNEYGTPVDVANDQDDGDQDNNVVVGPVGPDLPPTWEEMMRQVYGVNIQNALTGRLNMQPNRGPFPGGRIDTIIIDNPAEGIGFLGIGDRVDGPRPPEDRVRMLRSLGPWRDGLLCVDETEPE